MRRLWMVTTGVHGQVRGRTIHSGQTRTAAGMAKPQGRLRGALPGLHEIGVIARGDLRALTAVRMPGRRQEPAAASLGDIRVVGCRDCTIGRQRLGGGPWARRQSRSSWMAGLAGDSVARTASAGAVRATSPC